MLKYLLLGLLAARPRHGYDLKGIFDDAYGSVWPLNIAQIYNALSKLEEEGLVACEVVPQENVPNRKVYSITATGRKELERWSETPAAGPVRLRDEVYFKVLARLHDSAEDTLGVIRRQRHAHLEALAKLAAPQSGAANAEEALLVEAAALRLESELRWLERCEEQLTVEAGR